MQSEMLRAILSRCLMSSTRRTSRPSPARTEARQGWMPPAVPTRIVAASSEVQPCRSAEALTMAVTTSLAVQRRGVVSGLMSMMGLLD
ncbi:hypothetical protein AB433_04190 [Croceicoccus naphthovorans]|uniref:Uncharacterized protein n=1 Tax=Croceicoccus naphthovorans TaxID=1348774 RepID=A0A0G3XFH0_9SPHN|nr:hypothetical protein AB433_04190 [Croceicoccus naphthovorans]